MTLDVYVFEGVGEECSQGKASDNNSTEIRDFRTIERTGECCGQVYYHRFLEVRHFLDTVFEMTWK